MAHPKEGAPAASRIPPLRAALEDVLHDLQGALESGAPPEAAQAMGTQVAGLLGEVARFGASVQPDDLGAPANSAACKRSRFAGVWAPAFLARAVDVAGASLVQQVSAVLSQSDGSSDSARVQLLAYFSAVAECVQTATALCLEEALGAACAEALGAGVVCSCLQLMLSLNRINLLDNTTSRSGQPTGAAPLGKNLPRVLFARLHLQRSLADLALQIVASSPDSAVTAHMKAQYVLLATVANELPGFAKDSEVQAQVAELLFRVVPAFSHIAYQSQSQSQALLADEYKGLVAKIDPQVYRDFISRIDPSHFDESCRQAQCLYLNSGNNGIDRFPVSFIFKHAEISSQTAYQTGPQPVQVHLTPSEETNYVWANVNYCTLSLIGTSEGSQEIVSVDIEYDRIVCFEYITLPSASPVDSDKLNAKTAETVCGIRIVVSNSTPTKSTAAVKYKVVCLYNMDESERGVGIVKELYERMSFAKEDYKNVACVIARVLRARDVSVSSIQEMDAIKSEETPKSGGKGSKMSIKTETKKEDEKTQTRSALEMVKSQRAEETIVPDSSNLESSSLLMSEESNEATKTGAVSSPKVSIVTTPIRAGKGNFSKNSKADVQKKGKNVKDKDDIVSSLSSPTSSTASYSSASQSVGDVESSVTDSSGGSGHSTTQSMKDYSSSVESDTSLEPVVNALSKKNQNAQKSNVVPTKPKAPKVVPPARKVKSSAVTRKTTKKNTAKDADRINVPSEIKVSPVRDEFEKQDKRARPKKTQSKETPVKVPTYKSESEDSGDDGDQSEDVSPGFSNGGYSSIGSVDGMNVNNRDAMDHKTLKRLEGEMKGMELLASLKNKRRRDQETDNNYPMEFDNDNYDAMSRGAKSRRLGPGDGNKMGLNSHAQQPPFMWNVPLKLRRELQNTVQDYAANLSRTLTYKGVVVSAALQKIAADIRSIGDKYVTEMKELVDIPNIGKDTKGRKETSAVGEQSSVNISSEVANCLKLVDNQISKQRKLISNNVHLINEIESLCNKMDPDGLDGLVAH